MLEAHVKKVTNSATALMQVRMVDLTEVPPSVVALSLTAAKAIVQGM